MDLANEWLLEHADLLLKFPLLHIIVFIAVHTGAYIFNSLPRPTLPVYVADRWLIDRIMDFFNHPWVFYHSHMSRAPEKLIVRLSGESSRQVFFEHRSLSIPADLGTLHGRFPGVKHSLIDDDEPRERIFHFTFVRDFVEVTDRLFSNAKLPHLLKDVYTEIHSLTSHDRKATNPFDSIYRLVFQLTMRTIACDEIADDSNLLARSLELYEVLDNVSTPLSIMYSWMPLSSYIYRSHASTQFLHIVEQLIAKRIQGRRRKDDALQYLIDSAFEAPHIATVSIPVSQARIHTTDESRPVQVSE